MDTPGMRPARPHELTRVEDRLSFVYVERCTIGRDSNAITATDDRGVVHIPAASLGTLLLGPGTRVTHQAMVLLADSGSTAVWVGERGVRYYAHGRGLARGTRMLEAQAAAVSNRRSRLAVARAMYAMRFPDEDVEGLSMHQLRGREGARVRKIYRNESERTGVEWHRRDYDPADFAASDEINQALSAAHTSLYGVVHAVIAGLGCSPGLGFVHNGHDRAFVYDVADLYKADVTIPIAFSVVAQWLGTTAGNDAPVGDVASMTRRAVRDAMREHQVIARCVTDLRHLLLPNDEDAGSEADVLELWDDRIGRVAGGVNYEDDVPW